MKFLHILTVVFMAFMAAPLYNLVVVNERPRFGKAHLQVDQDLLFGGTMQASVFRPKQGRIDAIPAS